MLAREYRVYVATEISISASVGSTRWLNVSLVMTQKLPSSLGSRSPIVLIGRFRMTELDEYSDHDCIARSMKITTATPKPVTAAVRMDNPLSNPPKAYPTTTPTRIATTASTKTHQMFMPSRRTPPVAGSRARPRSQLS